MKRVTLFDFAFKKSTSNQPEPPSEKKRKLASHCEEEQAEEEKNDDDKVEKNDNEEEELVCVDEDIHHGDRHDDDGTVIDVDDAKKKTQPQLKFRDAWKLIWPWLQNLPDGMRCTTCTSTGKDNALTRPGCDNYKTTTFKRHAQSNSHQAAVEAAALQKDRAYCQVTMLQ